MAGFAWLLKFHLLSNISLVISVAILLASSTFSYPWQSKQVGWPVNQLEMYSGANEGHPKFRHEKTPSKRVMRRSVDFRMQEKQLLDNILGPKVYDRRIRPGGIPGGSGVNLTSEEDVDGIATTIVVVNIYLRSINDIDDYKMEFSVQVTFREQWNDERLKFDDVGGRFRYLTLTDTDKVWMPDTFFRNEKQGHFHSILVNNVYVRVFPNGDVLYSIRISLTLSCPMNLKLYPMDRQTCSIRLASYGYTTDDITYLWKVQDPVQIAQNLSLPRFSIENYASTYCNVKTNTGEYSCLSVDLIFKRQFSYYLITIYIPGCMLVIVSWVSFWLDAHAVPARVALGVTTLLTMSTQTASINSALPPVAYTKAIDVWQGVCVTFVFSALLEYALVNYALRADRSYLLRKAALKNRRSSDGLMGLGDDDDCGLLFEAEIQEPSTMKAYKSSSQQSWEQAYPASAHQPHRLHNSPPSANGHVTQRRFCSTTNGTTNGGTNGGANGNGTTNGHGTNGLAGNHAGYNGSSLYGGGGGGGGDYDNGTGSRTNLLLNPLGSKGRNGDSGGRGASSIFLPPSSVTLLTGSSNQLEKTSLSDAKLSLSSSEAAEAMANGMTPPIRRKLPMEKAKRIDVASRIGFPLVFAVFNVAYWINYLVQARQEYLTSLKKTQGS